MVEFSGVAPVGDVLTPVLVLGKSEKATAMLHFLNHSAGDLTFDLWKAGPARTAIATVSVVDPGSGYLAVPTVTAAGEGSGAVFVVRMELDGVSVADGGSGYTSTGTVTLLGGSGTAPTATINGISAGAVTGVSLASRGDMTALPAGPVATSGGDGTGLTLSATWRVASIDVADGGSGWIDTATLSLEGNAQASAGLVITPTAADQLFATQPLAAKAVMQVTGLALAPAEQVLVKASNNGLSVVPFGVSAPVV